MNSFVPIELRYISREMMMHSFDHLTKDERKLICSFLNGDLSADDAKHKIAAIWTKLHTSQ